MTPVKVSTSAGLSDAPVTASGGLLVLGLNLGLLRDGPQEQR